MTRLAYQLGVIGSVLGSLAGLIELTVGAQIRPWIGNKENPAVLGVITLFLSSMAFGAVISAHNLEFPTHDNKLAIFLGVFLPAMICFTTVGRLWYLPGTLLTVIASLLAYQYWFSAEPASLAGTSLNIGQLVAGAGSLLILVSVGLGFWKSLFGLYHSEIQVEAEQIRYEVVPMDFIRITNLSTAPTIENVEASRVMYVYIFLILGGALAFIASLTTSRLFLGIGGGIALTGLILFLVWLPAILTQVGTVRTFESLLDLARSLAWGWYLSLSGTGLILVISLFQSRPG